jgi:hypothetical protein
MRDLCECYRDLKVIVNQLIHRFELFNLKLVVKFYTVFIYFLMLLTCSLQKIHAPFMTFGIH